MIDSDNICGEEAGDANAEEHVHRQLGGCWSVTVHGDDAFDSDGDTDEVLSSWRQYLCL